MHHHSTGNNTDFTNRPGRPSRTLYTRSGFTLVEILVVIAILSILAGIVLINTGGQTQKARVAAEKTQLRALKSAIVLYESDNGNIPTMQQGIGALVQAPTIPPVPEKFPADGYLSSRREPVDAWNNPYIYLVPGRNGESFEIISYGSDGQPGGIDDAADLSTSDL